MLRFIIGLIMGLAVVSVFPMPVWAAGAVIGLYVWWMCSDTDVGHHI